MLGPAPTPSLLEQNADRVAPTTPVTAKQQPGATHFTSIPTLDGGTPLPSDCHCIRSWGHGKEDYRAGT